MAKIKVDFSYTGLESSEILQHSAVVEEINQELIEKSEDETEFLGWLNLPTEYDKKEFARIKRCAHKIRKDSDILLVIGIGGSYLGARAVIEALKGPFYNMKEDSLQVIFVGNNLSSEYINDVIEILEGKNFSINVISKSGTTTEPAIAFRIFREIIEGKYGIKEARKRIYVTTDEKKGALKQLAEAEGYETFVIPDDVGGRFSVLTAVGLLPIASCGINIDKIMDGARFAQDKYSDRSLEYNECYQYAVVRNLLYEDDKSLELMAAYEPKMHYFIEWWKQLFGESEGKDGKGLFPVGAEFTTDLHSLGQYIQEGRRIMFETILDIEKVNKDMDINLDEDNLDNLNYLCGKKLSYINSKAMEGTIHAHVDGGVPNIIIHIDELNENTMGQLIYFFEKACSMSAELLEGKPLKHPDVEKYKTNMFKLLKKPGYEN